VRFYILKHPGKRDSSAESNSEIAHVAESMATFDIGENQHVADSTANDSSKGIPSDFELPRTEEALPIR
ncbi:MAG TPA: hypothetical protein VNR38_08970, partial [Ureibacillus sp.]|nr:hypothetical protein [Ureibacillus sp.]